MSGTIEPVPDRIDQHQLAQATEHAAAPRLEESTATWVRQCPAIIAHQLPDDA